MAQHQRDRDEDHDRNNIRGEILRQQRRPVRDGSVVATESRGIASEHSEDELHQVVQDQRQPDRDDHATEEADAGLAQRLPESEIETESEGTHCRRGQCGRNDERQPEPVVESVGDDGTERHDLPVRLG